MSNTQGKNTIATACLLDEQIAGIALGDRDAVAALYKATKTAVYGYALSILKNVEDAEDVLQDTYIKIWSAAGTYNSMGKPMAWILTITKNLATSVLRERKKASKLSDDDLLLPCTDSIEVNIGNKLVLNAALKTLGDTERQIFLLHATSGLKNREIAEFLGLPLSTVLSKYSRAGKKLKKSIMEEES